jgi:hypothetical protein
MGRHCIVRGKSQKNILFFLAVTFLLLLFSGCKKKDDDQKKGWVEKGRMPEKCYRYASTVLNDKIYIYGGTPNSRFEHYDPAFNSTSCPTSYKTIYLTGPAAAAWNNKLYVLGGYGKSVVTDEVDVYDPSTTAWKTLKTLNTARVGLCAAVVNGKLYAIGGSTSDVEMLEDCIATVEMLDLNNDTANWVQVSPMSLPRAGATAAVIDGKIGNIRPFNRHLDIQSDHEHRAA